LPLLFSSPHLSGCKDAAAKGSPDKVTQHLATFEHLDFNVYTHQKWDEFGKSHAKDIIVHYPDGHTTKAQRRLGHAELGRRAGKAALLGDDSEGGEVVKVVSFHPCTECISASELYRESRSGTRCLMGSGREMS